MRKTGIFYHRSFSRRSYLTAGNRLADFPDALVPLLSKENILLYESKPVPKELVLKIHTPKMVQEVESTTFCSTAYESAGGVVEATQLILTNQLTNAFCFIGCGGHHAGRDYFWGACCFNDVILAITNARETINPNLRFVILDTDAHHGDGTRQLLELHKDTNTLHLCLCDREWHSDDGLRHDFDVTWVTYDRDPDGDYIKIVEKALSIASSFKHDLFYWYMGFDTYRGDYGSVGLSRECFLHIASMVKDFARQHTHNKLQVVLAGGSLREMATWLIPKVIDKLSTWEDQGEDS